MIQAVLLRHLMSDHGSIGRLLALDVDLDIKMIELPDRNNEVGMSRIPAGTYRCVPYNSPKFGRVWKVLNVPGRSAILIHKGNLAGDTRKKLKTHSRGCLLPGWYLGRIVTQQAVLNSTRAFSDMKSKIGDNPFILKIIDLC